MLEILAHDHFLSLLEVKFEFFCQVHNIHLSSKIGLESNLVLHITVDISYFLQEQTCYISTYLNAYLSLFQYTFHPIEIGEEVAIVASHILLPDPLVELEEISLVIVESPNLIMLVQFFQYSKSLNHHSLAF